ncbi:MAG TPA: 2-dehydropantoate 2-reductase [Gaiella sp.]|nr:2-dehydropantoate 2-reductase [Gaiella sp.]
MSDGVLVVGAGSLGSVYGARLAQGGAAVQLYAREEHARAIEAAGGVVVERGDDAELVALRAEWRPERVEPAPTVIVLTKAPDTEAALAGLDHVREGIELAVSLQNGVEKDDVLVRWCGAEAVVGGVSMVGGTLLEPGRVAHTLDGGTILGELPRGRSERVERLASALGAGGLRVVVSDDVRAVEWAKLVHASPTMAVPALVRLPLHACLISEPLAALYVTLVREGIAIAAAHGIEVDDGPVGYPLREVAAAPDETAVALVRERGRALEAAGRTEIRVSMLQSIERGRRTEFDAIHGFLVREAARLGVDAPATTLCHRLLAGIDERLS